MPTGIIGGSGLYGIEGLRITEEVPVSTPFGDPSDSYKIGVLDGNEVVFLPRHGIPHAIPPHKVNYRANIWGFRHLGVERIISVSAVGGINADMPPGSIVLLDQIIDMTGGARVSTFFEAGRVVHIDFTGPYCAETGDLIAGAAKKLGLSVKSGGTYVCVNGPRLETAKEIRFFAMIGSDVVGMTAMPEAALAREMEMCISGVAVVTNRAAGISGGKLTTEEVVEKMKESLETIKSLIRTAVPLISGPRACACKDALKGAVMS